MPTAIFGVGIAVLFGIAFPDLPEGNSLRLVLGLVIILFSAHRFVASRYGYGRGDERRFGGERPRPWENEEQDKSNGSATIWILALLLSTATLGCKPRAPVESMTAGHAVIGASDAVFNLAWKLSGAFQAGNRAAFVDIVRNNNRALVDSLANQRAEEILLDRRLMPAETLAIKAEGLKIYTYPLAYWPVFLLAAKDNPVGEIDSAELRRALTGELKNWKEIGGDDRRLSVYSPFPGEGGFQTLADYFGGLDSAVVEPCSTSTMLLEKAKDDDGALLIWSLPVEGLPYKQLAFRREGIPIRADVGTLTDIPSYPFRLDITYVTTHNKGDVAAGYLTFIVGNVGQREVMRLGYRPAATPVRIVRMKKSRN